MSIFEEPPLRFAKKCVLLHNAANTKKVTQNYAANFFKIRSLFRTFFWTFYMNILPKGIKNCPLSFHCEKCYYTTCNKKDFTKHLSTRKHNFLQNGVEKKSPTFYCSFCDYTASTKQLYAKHISTRKHEILQNVQKNVQNVPSSVENVQPVAGLHICSICNKKCNSRQSFDYHKNICKPPTQPNAVSAEVMTQLMKQNETLQKFIIEQTQEMKNMLLEIAKKESVVNVNHNMNTQNNHFNLNMFLNEKCKDAMNFVDFVNSLQVSFEELENMAHKGYVAGMSDIILNGLKDLDVYHRPIHCTDIKREIMYIKDNNEWIKDDDQTHVKRVITMVGRKNMRRVGEWQRAHPKCEITDSKEQYLHMNIMQQCLNGETQYECQKNDAKIIKNIAKFTYLDKGRNIAIM